MKRRGSGRYRGPNPFCSSEEWKRREEKHEHFLEADARYHHPIAAAARLEQGAIGLAVLALYAQRDRMNAADPNAKFDPWEIDHIRPKCQGGTDVRENLRLLPRSLNTFIGFRSEEEIAELLRLNKIEILNS